jgi:hypothetical protein
MAIDTTQDWTEAYKELCAIIKANVTEVKHTDMWYQQLDFEEKEYPWGNHSVFFDFNTDDIKSVGNLAQEMNCQIGVYHVFNTLSDTFDGAANQNTALSFMPVIRKINNALHGKAGVNFSSMSRIALKRYNAPSYLVCYYQVYSCIIMDYSAAKQFDETQSLNDIPVTLQITKQTVAPTGDQTNAGFVVEM